MSLSFRKRQPIPELHIDEAARAVAAQHAESDEMPVAADIEHLSMVDQLAQIRLQEVRTINDQRAKNLNQI